MQASEFSGEAGLGSPTRGGAEAAGSGNLGCVVAAALTRQASGGSEDGERGDRSNNAFLLAVTQWESLNQCSLNSLDLH